MLTHMYFILYFISENEFILFTIKVYRRDLQKPNHILLVVSS